jgi:uncharacterized protein YjiS (DUF1127 family)
MIIAAFVQPRDVTRPLDLGAMLRRASDSLRRRALYARTVRELAAHTDRELADFGFRRDQIRRIARESAGL